MATIFTKIIEGEIPCYKIMETETHISFLDIRPSAEGHTLVVPKPEIDYFFDLPDDLYRETTVLTRQIANAIDNALNPIRTGIIVEGLEVPHAHVHLIPIYNTNQPFTLSHTIDLTDREMEKVAKKIREVL